MWLDVGLRTNNTHVRYVGLPNDKIKHWLIGLWWPQTWVLMNEIGHFQSVMNARNKLKSVVMWKVRFQMGIIY